MTELSRAEIGGPQTEEEMVEYLVTNGVDRMEAEHIAAIEFGSSQGCCVPVPGLSLPKDTIGNPKTSREP